VLAESARRWGALGAARRRGALAEGVYGLGPGEA